MKVADPFKDAIKTYRTVLVSTIIFSAAINALMFVGPLYMLQVYDRVLQSRSEMTLLALTGIALAMLGVYGILEFVRSRVLVRAGMRFDKMISSSVFNRVVTGTLAQPKAQSQFALNDIDKLREFFTGSGLIALCDVPWVPVFLAVCFIFHPLIGWVATGGALVIFILALINEFTTKKALGEAGNYSQNAQHFANTTLQNVESIRALGMESNLRSRWADMHQRMLGRQADASDRAGALLSASKFVRLSMQVFILGTGAYLALHREISPGAMIAASIMMGRALSPVDQVVGQWKSFVAARKAFGRLRNMFKSIPGEAQKTSLPRAEGRVSAEGLVVAAPGARSPILQGVAFKLDPGEVMALVGPSGAGKSSLVRALVGVWPTPGGAVRLDGAELSNWDSEQLGQQLGYLPQTVELFSGTIAENIARFNDAKSEDIIKAAKLARVHDMIQQLPDGYDTQIGDSGRQLSGGQRQRVGLARALFGDPAFIVLDEPNANLDIEGEEALFEVVKELREARRTVVFVSHKMSLVSLSDKALLLADGRMRAFGPTREVLKPKVTPQSREVKPVQNPDAASQQGRATA